MDDKTTLLAKEEEVEVETGAELTPTGETAESETETDPEDDE